jgi:hypothetical protein
VAATKAANERSTRQITCARQISTSFLDAVAHRGRDEDLLRLIHRRLTYDSKLWRIDHRAGAGRCLVATSPIPAATKIFTERPIVVAKGGAAAVANAILALERESEDFAAVGHLHSLASGEQGGELGADWAAGVAINNVHGAGGNLLDPSAERRTVLGLLASMMMHECCPSAVTHISGLADGSHVSLHATRRIEAGEALSISYEGSYQPTARRRELLLRQHRFMCMCRRCTTLPEHARAFRCPNCGEGPCSPVSPAPSNRQLECDACECVMELDETAWQELLDAEKCSVVCEKCLPFLHPYHHRPMLMYQTNMKKLQPRQRADFLEQQSNARERLYEGICGEGLAHPLVANDVESTAVALLAADDAEAAADKFRDASARFAAFYGAGSPDAARCAMAATLKRIEDYKALGVQQLEVRAHH